MAEKFFVYILQSMKDFSFYIGQCDDLDKRMSKHFDGMSKYTSSKRPWRLVYFEMFDSRSDAIKREKQIKNMKSKKFIQNLLSNRWSGWTGPDLSGESVYTGNRTEGSNPSLSAWVKKNSLYMSFKVWRIFFYVRKCFEDQIRILWTL